MKKNDLKYEFNEVIFAKFNSYPWWPACINTIYVNKKWYEVIFFGDKSSAKLPKNKIKKWSTELEQKQRKVKRLESAFKHFDEFKLSNINIDNEYNYKLNEKRDLNIEEKNMIFLVNNSFKINKDIKNIKKKLSNNDLNYISKENINNNLNEINNENNLEVIEDNISIDENKINIDKSKNSSLLNIYSNQINNSNNINKEVEYNKINSINIDVNKPNDLIVESNSIIKVNDDNNSIIFQNQLNIDNLKNKIIDSNTNQNNNIIEPLKKDNMETSNSCINKLKNLKKSIENILWINKNLINNPIAGENNIILNTQEKNKSTNSLLIKNNNILDNNKIDIVNKTIKYFKIGDQNKIKEEVLINDIHNRNENIMNTYIKERNNTLENVISKSEKDSNNDTINISNISLNKVNNKSMEFSFKNNHSSMLEYDNNDNQVNNELINHINSNTFNINMNFEDIQSNDKYISLLSKFIYIFKIFNFYNVNPDNFKDKNTILNIVNLLKKFELDLQSKDSHHNLVIIVFKYNFLKLFNSFIKIKNINPDLKLILNNIKNIISFIIKSNFAESEDCLTKDDCNKINILNTKSIDIKDIFNEIFDYLNSTKLKSNDILDIYENLKKIYKEEVYKSPKSIEILLNLRDKIFNYKSEDLLIFKNN